MEIGNQSIDKLEAITWRNKEPGRAVIRLGLASIKAGNTFQDTHSGCANSDDAATRAARLSNHFRSLFIQVNFFAMHFMLTKILYLNWTEGIKAHMQSKKTNRNAFSTQTIQQCRSKV